MRNQNEIGAIETVYDGYRFRSRLEARWAVFFKTAGIRYTYELYLSCFYLPEVNMRTTEDKGGIYVVVEPSTPNYYRTDYLDELSWITGRSVLLVQGMPKVGGHYEFTCTFYCINWDIDMHFMRCYKCLRVCVRHRDCCELCEYCLKQSGEKSRCDAAHPSLVHAVKVARSYRFGNH
jgi:hypothetical protein